MRKRAPIFKSAYHELQVCLFQNKFIIWRLFLHHCQHQLKIFENSNLVRHTFPIEHYVFTILHSYFAQQNQIRFFHMTMLFAASNHSCNNFAIIPSFYRNENLSQMTLWDSCPKCFPQPIFLEGKQRHSPRWDIRATIPIDFGKGYLPVEAGNRCPNTSIMSSWLQPRYMHLSIT